jgi:hypothetical protein
MLSVASAAFALIIDDFGACSSGSLSATGSALLVGRDGAPALDPAGRAGMDLTEGGTHTGLSIETMSNDFTAPLSLTGYSSASDHSSITILPPRGMPSGSAQILSIPFASLIPTGSGADFTNVGTTSLLNDGSAEPQLDVSLRAPSTTPAVAPEPAPFLQVASGLIAMAWMRCRRRRWRRTSAG